MEEETATTEGKIGVFYFLTDAVEPTWCQLQEWNHEQDPLPQQVAKDLGMDR